jgi:hypothetical protein
VRVLVVFIQILKIVAKIPTILARQHGETLHLKAGYKKQPLTRGVLLLLWLAAQRTLNIVSSSEQRRK